MTPAPRFVKVGGNRSVLEVHRHRRVIDRSCADGLLPLRALSGLGQGVTAIAARCNAVAGDFRFPRARLPALDARPALFSAPPARPLVGSVVNAPVSQERRNSSIRVESQA